MLSIQLDDRAVFLERWRNLLLDLLRPEVVSHDRRRLELKTLLENWSGRASVDSADYRLVWEIRLRIVRAVLSPLTARCRQADPRFRLAGLECEAPIWALVTKRPAHLLDPAYHDWDSLLLAMVNATLAEATRSGQPLASRTWGEKNVVKIEHPMSLASPLLGRLLSLNMPAEPLPGGRKDMPRSPGPNLRRLAADGRHAGPRILGLFPHALRSERPPPVAPLSRRTRGVGERNADPVSARSRRSHTRSQGSSHRPEPRHPSYRWNGDALQWSDSIPLVLH